MVSRGCLGTRRAVRRCMVRLASAFVVLAIWSAVSFASPITVGAGLGITQDQVNTGQDPNSALSVFGRLGLTSHLSAELDITKVNLAEGVSARRISGFAVFDLGSNPHWVPHIFAGLGIDHTDAGSQTDGHHFEGGLGLEYRTTGGFTIGARFHLGGRSTDAQPKVDVCCTPSSPYTLQASEYRTLDAYAGIRF